MPLPLTRGPTGGSTGEADSVSGLVMEPSLLQGVVVMPLEGTAFAMSGASQWLTEQDLIKRREGRE
jgi:hypothetical protein